ncbi:hypothetical protein [Sphingomonas cavernae]|nr:hypothetical protein [Sphingomonas cavernae]
MTEQDDLSYYTRRERDERTLADKAAENCVRKLHTRLADEYARRARSAFILARAKGASRSDESELKEG